MIMNLPGPIRISHVWNFGPPYITAINHLGQLNQVVDSLKKIAPLAKYMKVIHEQTNRLEKIDDRWFDILDAAAEMPTVQLRAR